MKLLLTAFDPFGGASVNPALEAVKRVGDIPGVEVKILEVPTVFGASVAAVTAAVEEFRPDAVLCVGQAGGREGLTPERVAINVDDARIPDNAGNQPIDTPVVPGGPAAYFSTLPIKAMAAAIRAAGLPASVSNTAGTFVCNHLMYGVLHELARRHPTVRGGFLHVPFLPEQTVSGPSLPAEDIARGLEAAIAAIRDHGADIAAAEGREH